MRHRFRHSAPLRWVLVARLALLASSLAGASGCSHSPTSPSPSGIPTPPNATAPGVIELRMEGPTRVTPGESPRYAAIEVYADGATKDVTSTAMWTPAATGFPIYFTAPGVTAPATRGEALLVAYNGRLARMQVLVLEPGTFKLSGSVVSAAGGGPLAGATVEVVSGIGQGIETLVASGGEFGLYGVAGHVQIRASAQGFAPQVHEVSVTANDATDAFVLAPLEAPALVGGVWTMTVAPAPSCRSGLPENARGRSYRVEFEQTGTHIRATISSPTLERTVTDFRGTVLGSRMRLLIYGDTDYGLWSYPTLVDRLSPSEIFGFDGMIDGTLAGATIRGTLDGDLVYWSEWTYDPTWYCRAQDHMFALSR